MATGNKKGKSKSDSSIGLPMPPAPPIFTTEMVERLLAPVIGVPTAQLVLTIDKAVGDPRMKDVEEFVSDSKAQSRVDLTVDLAGDTTDLAKKVVKVLDLYRNESVKLAICASSGSPPGPGHKPPKKPHRPPRPVKDEPPKPPTKRKP